MKKATTKRARRAARKLFPKKSHSTRPFSKADCDALSKLTQFDATAVERGVIARLSS